MMMRFMDEIGFKTDLFKGHKITYNEGKFITKLYDGYVWGRLVIDLNGCKFFSIDEKLSAEHMGMSEFEVGIILGQLISKGIVFRDSVELDGCPFFVYDFCDNAIQTLFKEEMI